MADKQHSVTPKADTNQAANLCVVCEERPATGTFGGEQTCGRLKCDYTVAEFETRPEAPDSGHGSRLPLSHQEKAIAQLHEAINQLADRLNPILTPVNTVNEGVERSDEAKDVVSPLTDQLNANNRDIRRASDNLRGLMERLEC